MPRLESSIERAVCEYAKRLGCYVIKLNGMGKRSLPDRLLLHSGHTLFIEFKQQGKKPTPLQQFCHECLAKVGFTVYVVDDVAFGKALVDNLISGVTQ